MVKQKQEQALEEQKDSAQQSATQLIEQATDESEMARMSLQPSLPVPSSLINLLEQPWKALRPI